MDMGVGSFVFAQGLTSASPLLRSPSFIRASLVPKLVRSVKKVVPMFALAVARIIAVKGTAYPVRSLTCTTRRTLIDDAQ
jgi:phosphatidylinositol glycan class W